MRGQSQFGIGRMAFPRWSVSPLPPATPITSSSVSLPATCWSTSPRSCRWSIDSINTQRVLIYGQKSGIENISLYETTDGGGIFRDLDPNFIARSTM